MLSNVSKIQKVYIPVEDRPKCVVPGCTRHGQHTGGYKKNGTPIFRKMCAKHHYEKIAKKRGLKNITEVLAKNAGFDTATQYLNSKHPSRQYRKNYCENTDGRLGFKCTTTIVWEGQLQVDHIDGNPKNEVKENYQTLCACCHAYKTHIYKDYLSPGRKALGIKH